MTRKYRKKGACKTAAKITGNHVTVHTTCPVKPKVVKAPCVRKHKKYRHKPVPQPCKGLKGRAKKECVRIMHKKYQ